MDLCLKKVSELACLSELVIADEAIAFWVLPVVDVAALRKHSCKTEQKYI